MRTTIAGHFESLGEVPLFNGLAVAEIVRMLRVD